MTGMVNKRITKHLHVFDYQSFFSLKSGQLVKPYLFCMNKLALMYSH